MSASQLSADLGGQLDRTRDNILDIHQLARSVQLNRSKHSFSQVAFKDLSRFKNSKGHIKEYWECLVLYKYLGRPSPDFELHSLNDFNKVPYVRGRDIPTDKCALGYVPFRIRLPKGILPAREIITMWGQDEYVKDLDSHFAYHCILHLETCKVAWTRVGDWFCNNCKMVSWAKRNTCNYGIHHQDEDPHHFLKKEIAICEPEVQAALDMGMRVFVLSGSHQGIDVLNGKPGRKTKDKSKKGNQQRNDQRNERNQRTNQGTHKRDNRSTTSTASTYSIPAISAQPSSQGPNTDLIPTQSQPTQVHAHRHKKSAERSSNVGIIGSKPPQIGSPSNLLNSSLLSPPVANHSPLKQSANAANAGINSYASVAHRPQRALPNMQFNPLSTQPQIHPQLHATTSYSTAPTPANNGKALDFTPDLPRYSPISDYKTIEAFNRDTLRAGSTNARPAQRALSQTTSMSSSISNFDMSLSPSPRATHLGGSSVTELTPLSMTPSNSTQSAQSTESSPIEPIQLDFLNNYTNYSRLIPRSSASQLGSITLPNHAGYYNNDVGDYAAMPAIDNYSSRSELALNNFMQQLDMNRHNAGGREKEMF